MSFVYVASNPIQILGWYELWGFTEENENSVTKGIAQEHSEIEVRERYWEDSKSSDLGLLHKRSAVI